MRNILLRIKGDLLICESKVGVDMSSGNFTQRP